MKNYELGLKGQDWKTYVSAPSAGKAKYQYLLDVSEAWPDVSFKHITCRAIKTLPLTPKQIAQQEADEFNARAPLGTTVEYWTWVREGEGHHGFTRSEASVMCDHAVVWVTGCAGSICLSHVRVEAAK